MAIQAIQSPPILQLTTSGGRRYVIQSEIGAGGMGIVYQALDRLTGNIIALKRVRTDRLVFDDSLDDTVMMQLALAREFTTLAALRHPNIISVLDYGFDNAREPFFTMEYIDHGATLSEAGHGLDLAGQIDLLIQILQALTYLHRHGVLHRDLKPANVLVAAGTAKVLDFGLATRHGDSGAVSGTLAYMAPELFEGGAPSIASDLYAVGVMAYELIAGQHPYADSLMILGQEMYSTPDMTQLAAPVAVRDVIAQLMLRDPDARFQSANAAILAFYRAIDRITPPETDAIRESFLQAAPFIGREAEAALIIESVEQTIATMANPVDTSIRGAAWLIGGESGIGKSRLMEEIRVQTLVKGALVLRGQATNTGGSAYELWHDVLRWLVLLTDLSPLEAGVLYGLFPDLPLLPAQDTQADFVVPELTAEATRLRLFRVVEAVFIRCLEGLQNAASAQAVLIILEDLQWAGAGLGLLNRLLALSGQFPVIFLGSYRSDEMPDLPAQFPSMHHLLIEPLSGTQIAAVSESMLGEAGRDPNMIALLERETEGNLFFLVEVVRTLAEQAGRLEQIGQSALPATVFSERLRNAVQARLARLPNQIRLMLQIAAAVGRMIDLDLLAAIGRAEPGFDLQQWLLTSADYAMIEIHDARWRFVHDKFREGLLDGLLLNARAAIHQKVALGLEQAHPAAVDNLAYHWDLAGNSIKARHFAGLAGDQAVRSGAFKQAVIYLYRALALSEVTPQLDRFAEARLEKRLGEAYLGLDDTRQVRAHLEAAARKFGYPLVTEPAAVRVALVREIAVQFWHRLQALIRPNAGDRPFSPAMRANLSDVASVYHDHMMSSYFLNDGITASYTTVRGLNLVESMALHERKSAAYAGVALVSSLTLPRRVSVAYNRLAVEAAQHTVNSIGKATGLHMVGLVSAGHADWDLAAAALRDSIDYNLTVGDLLRWQYTINILVEIDYLRANYAQSYARNEESVTGSRRYGFDQIETWGYRRRATNLFRQGKVSEAHDWLTAALPFYANHADLINEANAYGLLASIQLREGDRGAAQESAQHVSTILGDRAPLGYYLMDAYNGIAEVRFDDWLTNTSSAVKQAAAAHALRQIDSYGRSFRVGKPRAALFSGQYLWHSGQPDKALIAWQRALRAATVQQMPFERGLTLLALGQHSEETVSRTQYLTAAARQFEQIGTPHELVLAKTTVREAN
jgi:tRNA A-37 threonylcarbamoyl transferase component Bud32/tetratricopeptide (TPR) repeat protein